MAEYGTGNACILGSRDRKADGYTRHAWVRINGKYYDPEAHFAGWRRNIYAVNRYPISYKIQNFPIAGM